MEHADVFTAYMAVVIAFILFAMWKSWRIDKDELPEMRAQYRYALLRYLIIAIYIVFFAMIIHICILANTLSSAVPVLGLLVLALISVITRNKKRKP